MAVLARARIFILLFWLLLALAAIPVVLTLFDHLGMEYNAPEGTQAARARHLFEQEFAKEPYESSVVLLQRDNGQSVLTEEAAQFTKARNDYVRSAYGDTAEVGFACRTAESLDIVDNAFRIFPRMVVAVLAVIYIIIGLMFRSAIIPLRLLITVALTISFIFGMFDLVFLRHWGAFLLPQIESIQGLFWILPIIAFCVIVGLGLDYELFILSRVKEAVWTGRTTREGIQDSLECTGRLVTGAGAIMIVSFGGMMFSTMVPLIEIGFVMGFAILIDATVVRILLVPALMSVADQWNWWPSRPPAQEGRAAGAKEDGADNAPPAVPER